MVGFGNKNNFFKFNMEMKRQKSRLVIGTKFALLILAFLWIQQKQNVLRFRIYNQWLHLIDNIFFIWSHREEKLVQFFNKLNNFHPNLSFTYETSKNNVSIYFQDLNVSLRNGEVYTGLYIKLRDGQQYLLYQSSRPQHIKVSIPYSQLLRINRICLSEKDFKAYFCRMKKWFLANVYPEKVINDQVDKIVFANNSPIKKSSENGIPFVFTSYPIINDFNQLIKDLLQLLYSDEEVEKVFSPTPIT